MGKIIFKLNDVTVNITWPPRLERYVYHMYQTLQAPTKTPANVKNFDLQFYIDELSQKHQP